MTHPEPFTHAVAALQRMDGDSYLYMLNRKNPIPLLEMIKEKGFHTLSYEDDTRDWHILITKNPNSNLEALLDVS